MTNDQSPDSPAATRENSLPAPASAPAPLWLIALGGLAVVVAGLVLGDGGAWFKYSCLARPGYVRIVPDGDKPSGPQSISAIDAYKRRGEKIYERCMVCHQADGKGDDANYPPLAGSEWVIGPTEQVAMIVLNGLTGPMSTGKAYPGGMPLQGLGMSPEDLAAVMTYIRNSFGNETGDVVSIAQAKKAMEISAARTPAMMPVTAEELAADHAKDIDAESVAPDQLVDPVTLQALGK